MALQSLKIMTVFLRWILIGQGRLLKNEKVRRVLETWNYKSQIKNLCKLYC